MADNVYTVKLLDKKKLTHDLLELRFSRPTSFEFLAGQFVQFQVPNGERIVRRSYSIASTPADAELEFCVKLLPDGVAANHFLQMPLGSSINLVGPAGRFTCTSERDCFFVATGAGLAPIMAQIKYLLENSGVTDRLTLLFGARSSEDIFWQNRLDDLARRFPNFSYQLTLSRPAEDWSGLSGHVTRHFPEILVGQDFYLCGSLAMVQEARGLLLSGGVAAPDIHFEIF